MKTLLSTFCLGVVVALVGGCATPEYRIKQNPEAFNRLTPSQQVLVKAGRVDVGFDKDAVKLALGSPDRVLMRVDQTGRSEVWVYVNYRTVDGVVLYRGWYHRYWGWGGGYYMDYPYRVPYNRVKVIFKDDKVVSAEQQIS